MELLTTIVVMGLAVSAVSVTISRTDAFFWLRAFAASWSWTGKLVACHWCLGWWFALVATIVVNPWPGPAGFVMTWLAVTAVSGIAASRILGEG